MKRAVALLTLASLVGAACGSSDDARPASPDPLGSTVPTDVPPISTSPATSPATTQPKTPATSPATSPGPSDPSSPVMPVRAASAGEPQVAGEAVADFGFELLAGSSARADAGANVVVSPLSVAIALALLEPGATGDGQTQLHELLGIDDRIEWHAAMSALEQALESRTTDDQFRSLGEEQDPGEVAVNVADAAFLQPGYPFRDDYLDAIGTTYGPVLEELDFEADQQAAADRINAFIADATDDRITDLVSADAIDPSTVLALVNALLLKASWLENFDRDQTVDTTFQLADGADVTVPMMFGSAGRSGSGDGWVAATKPLVGGLAVEFYLPDAGRLDDVETRFAEVADDYAEQFNPGGLLGVPRFETRVDTTLTEMLPDLGLTAVFQKGNLLGIADDPKLVVDKVLHQAWVSFDEDGVEAAAATILLAVTESAPIDPPIDVVLDRPFLFRIIDQSSGATLFTGRIVDPTA